MIALTLSIVALALGIFNFVKGRNMASQISVKESLQQSINLAVEAMNNSSAAIVAAIAKLQELKGALLDDSWLEMANVLDAARQSNVAAAQAMAGELGTDGGMQTMDSGGSPKPPGQ